VWLFARFADILMALCKRCEGAGVVDAVYTGMEVS
jgi:hypothetical protein